MSVRRALTAVTIIESHDVILAEVGARLHLDDVQRNHPRILDAVLHADRNVGRLVLLQEENLVAAGDTRRAGNHDPVLGTVMMHLQRQGRARLDLQTLHLETGAAFDAVVTAPGAEYLAMQG